MIRKYRIHILVFLLASLTIIILAHPSIFVTDEWITINQLAQLQEGHQVLINEGKYLPDPNSTYAGYFAAKNNYLAYPLFLPIISVPALWFVNWVDRFFIIGIIYFSTFLLIAVAIFVNAYFPEYMHLGKYRWTSGLIVVAFFLFFANLFYNRPFPVTGGEAFPEVMAVVLTNMALFSLMAVAIYEINRLIFLDTAFSIFGTFVCISCSSYLFWTNYCKDHLLLAFLFVLLTLLLVKYLSVNKLRYLYGSFVMAGLLAWARPELAFFVFAVLSLFVFYLIITQRRQFSTVRDSLSLIAAPFFTIAGAIPFFINNYLFTGNFFIPAWIFWHQSSISIDSGGPGSAAVPQVSHDTVGSLLNLFLSTTNFHPATLISDTYGVIFNPQSGSLGVFPVVPVFLVAIFLVPILIILGKWQVTPDEKKILVAIILLALGVFFAYVRGISGMNISLGIVPDMRYLSPIYLPLDLIGLLIIRKIPIFSENPEGITKKMLCTWIILIPVTILVLVKFYPEPETADELFRSLNSVTVLIIYLFVMFALIGILGTFFFRFPESIGISLLAILCSLPLIWQVDVSFVVRMYGVGLGGYSYLLPALRSVLLLHFI